MLPESRELCRVQQVSFKTYYELNKFIQNDVDNHIEEALLNILTTYTNKATFTSLDAYVTLLFMRTISIGSALKLATSNVIYKVDLLSMLQKFSSLVLPDAHFTFNDKLITIKTPSNKLFDFQFEDYLYSITADSEMIVLSPQQKQQLYNELPATIVSTIKEYERCVEEVINKISIMLVTDTVICSFTQNTMFEFVKLLYKDNLISCQRKLISIVSYFNVDINYLNTLPPAELEILLGIIAEQEDKDTSKSLPSITPTSIAS